jgi:anaerobic dimethyl sulfoxide reductase subunit B (iron-sulfur subunit)
MARVVSQYAFLVNSDACSGCKTCQVACKDKNDLPAGLHWRRVFEVSAGGWKKVREAWTSTVVAYNLSAACHHCEDPVCGKQCSVNAIEKRTDGIVLIDQARCTKCQKCRADCPYEAIRYDATSNTVSKCDLCVDLIDAGQRPACVAACPNRALNVGELDDLRQRYGPCDRVFPLDDPRISRPALVIKPHRHAALVQQREPDVANWEEL